MVRFSDMLGGSGKPDDDAANSPYAELANDAADPESDADREGEAGAGRDTEVGKEPVPMATSETPEAVLSRLTQYATSARAAEIGRETVTEPPAATEPPDRTEPEREAQPEREPEPDPLPDPLSPVGDDFLPSVKRIVRRAGRVWKRQP
jgi:hypothetical protein